MTQPSTTHENTAQTTNITHLQERVADLDKVIHSHTAQIHGLSQAVTGLQAPQQEGASVGPKTRGNQLANLTAGKPSAGPKIDQDLYKYIEEKIKQSESKQASQQDKQIATLQRENQALQRRI